MNAVAPSNMQQLGPVPVQQVSPPPNIPTTSNQLHTQLELISQKLAHLQVKVEQSPSPLPLPRPSPSALPKLSPASIPPPDLVIVVLRQNISDFMIKLQLQIRQLHGFLKQRIQELKAQTEFHQYPEVDDSQKGKAQQEWKGMLMADEEAMKATRALASCERALRNAKKIGHAVEKLAELIKLGGKM